MTVVEDITVAPHACTVPVSDEQRWETTVGFLSDGLATGERVMYLDDGGVDALLQRLDDDRVPYREALRTGRFEIVPSVLTRTMLQSSAPEMLQIVGGTLAETVEKGYPGVRLAGDAGYALTLPGGGSTMLEYEAGLDGVLASGPGRMLCVYDRGRYPEDILQKLRGLHHTEVATPAIYDDSLLRITRTGPATTRVAGEVDHSNRPRIKRMLEVALDDALRSHSSSTEITIDLSSLRFLDVAGAVSLVHAAEEFPSTHRLVLTGVRPGVARLLDRCGAPFAEQLRVEPRTAVEDPVEER